MTNNKLTDGVIDVWFNAAKAAIHHPATPRSEHSHAFAAYMLAQEVKKLRGELQERRKADGIYHLPEVYEINGVFTRDVCALANARGAEVQGYVKVEVANRFFRDDKY